MLTKAGINIKRLFLNADAGFDSQELRQVCKDNEIEANIDINFRNNKIQNQPTDYQYFDEELYKCRTVIELANAWLDSFNALLVRFETKAINRGYFNFIVIFCSFFAKNQNKYINPKQVVYVIFLNKI